ncbi:MAG: hypothetical protein U5J63_16805 [Fodinibius sp.]|nr:hypothetical protein [Fodinibius sp.]
MVLLTVAYPGQTARLDMLSDMDSYVGQGDDGQLLSGQKLLNMLCKQ